MSNGNVTELKIKSGEKMSVTIQTGSEPPVEIAATAVRVKITRESAECTGPGGEPWGYSGGGVGM